MLHSFSRSLRPLLTASLLASAALTPVANAQDPVRLGFMDPLSGTFASVSYTHLTLPTIYSV